MLEMKSRLSVRHADLVKVSILEKDVEELKRVNSLLTRDNEQLNSRCQELYMSS